MKRSIRMNPSDNVTTALANLDAGETIQVVSASQEPLEQLKALQPISFGHKIALNRIEKGSNIVKYGEVIGIATQSIEKGKPYLGICLGLQILFSESEEFGAYKGLDLVRGKVVKLKPDPEHKVPHMGWNTIEKEKEIPMLQGIESGDFFYFVHSYYVIPEEPQWISTFTNYGKPFVSSIWKENLFATQFHPEKSQQKGLRILENFVKSI